LRSYLIQENTFAYQKQATCRLWREVLLDACVDTIGCAAAWQNQTAGKRQQSAHLAHLAHCWRKPGWWVSQGEHAFGPAIRIDDSCSGNSGYTGHCATLGAKVRG